MKLEVKVTVTRNGDSKTYLLNEVGESKGGNFKLFASKDNADIPDFGKMYIKAKRESAKAGKKS